jgi:hypothetical protein
MTVQAASNRVLLGGLCDFVPLLNFLELVAKLTFQVAMRDDGTSQQHEGFMRCAAGLLAHPQLPELMKP